MTAAVHPISLAAAFYGPPTNGLQAKFSIPYLVAYPRMHGPPWWGASPSSIRRWKRWRGVEQVSDRSVLESEAGLGSEGTELARDEAPLGSSARPMSSDQLAGKLRSLSGGRLDGALNDPDRAAGDLLEAAGLA